MDKIDARTLSQDAQYEKRKMIIELRKKGMKNREVAEIVGISETYTSTVWSSYKKDGEKAISKGKRGRRKGSCQVLSKEQEQWIQKTMINKTPEQLKFKFALWTRQAVQDLIKREYGITIPLRTLTDYLSRWGFTCQKPAKQAYEQQPAKVKAWLDEEYPAIQAEAAKDKAIIYWGDETGIENTEYRDRGFAPKGKTPVVRLNAKKERINMVSAVSNRGKMRFMFYDGSMNSDRLIEFMRRLIRDADQKVYLILDNLRVHHSKKVTQWADEHSDQIRLYFLPPYSPQMNPDEYLNGDLKRHVHSGSPSRSRKALKSKAKGYMMKIQRKTEHIRSYFRNRHVIYAQ